MAQPGPREISPVPSQNRTSDPTKGHTSLRRARLPIARRWVRAGLGALLAIAGQGCRSADAPVQELFALRNQGLLYLQRGQLAEAEEQFERLVELAPDEPLGHANLGLTHLRAGRFDEAEDRLRRARRLDPASVDIGLMLAKLYALTGRQEESRELLEEMREDAPGDARVPYALADLEGDAPQGAAALRQEQRLREVLAVAPANLSVRLRLAGALQLQSWRPSELAQFARPEVHVQHRAANAIESACISFDAGRTMPTVSPSSSRFGLMTRRGDAGRVTA